MSFIDHKCVCGRSVQLHDPWELKAHVPRPTEGSHVVYTYSNGGLHTLGTVGEVTPLMKPGTKLPRYGGHRAHTHGCKSCVALYDAVIESEELEPWPEDEEQQAEVSV